MSISRGLRTGLAIAAIICAVAAAALSGAAPATAAGGPVAAKPPATAAGYDRSARKLEQRGRAELRRARRCVNAAAWVSGRPKRKLLRRARVHRKRAASLARQARAHRRKAARLRRPVRRPVPQPAGVTPIRRAPVPLGTAISWSKYRSEPALEEIFLREFSQMTPENELKWDAIRPSRRRFDFTVSDQMIGYAAAHGKRVRGHALVWGEQNPAWLTNGSWTRDSLLAVMKTHIETVMQRYRGQVAEWDVVNEAIDDDGSYRDNIWLRVIGPDYVEHAFRFARQADPDARLYYNDAGIDLVNHPHTVGVARMLAELRGRGVPVDAMGVQGHVTLTYRATGAQFAETLRSFAALGLDVAVTEMEVSLDVLGPPGELLERQRAVYGDYAKACREEPRCTGFSTWGISDLQAWRRDQHPEWRPLMFDEGFAAKPALATVKHWIVEP